jgi:hypothetical protein
MSQGRLFAALILSCTLLLMSQANTGEIADTSVMPQTYICVCQPSSMMAEGQGIQMPQHWEVSPTQYGSGSYAAAPLQPAQASAEIDDTMEKCVKQCAAAKNPVTPLSDSELKKLHEWGSTYGDNYQPSGMSYIFKGGKLVQTVEGIGNSCLCSPV